MSESFAKNFGFEHSDMQRLRRSIASHSSGDYKATIMDFLDAEANKFIEEEAGKKIFRTFFQLSPDEQTYLEDEFTEWQFDFIGREPSGMAKRFTVMELITDEILAKFGKDHIVTIYGGNFLAHAARNRKNVVCWLPTFNQFERERNGRILDHFHAVLSTIKFDKKKLTNFAKNMADIRQNPDKWYREGNSYNVRSDVFIYHHYDCDHSIHDVARFAVEANADIVYGTFLLPVTMYLKNSGELPIYNAYFELDDQKEKLVLSVKGDVSSTRTFDFAKYSTFYTSNYGIYGEHRYLVEAVDMRDGLACFRMTRVKNSVNRVEFVAHNVWWKNADRYCVIDKFEHKYEDGASTTRPMSSEKVLVPFALTQFVRNEAFELPLDKFSVKTIRGLIRDRNRTIMINSVNVSTDITMDSQLVNDLAIAVFRDVCEMKYQWSELLDFIFSGRAYKEDIAKAGFFKTVWMALTTSHASYYRDGNAWMFVDNILTGNALTNLYEKWTLALRQHNMEYFPDSRISSTSVFTRYSEYLEISSGIITGAPTVRRPFNAQIPHVVAYSRALNATADAAVLVNNKQSDGVLDNPINNSVREAVAGILRKYKKEPVSATNEVLLESKDDVTSDDLAQNNPRLKIILDNITKKYGDYRGRQIPLFTTETMPHAEEKDEQTPVSRVNNPVAVLQDVICDTFPGILTEKIRDDAAKVEFSNINYLVGNPMQLDISKGQHLKNLVGLQPVLKTPMEVDRQQTQLQTAIGALKRNMNVPNLEEPMGENFCEEVWENFVSVCCHNNASVDLYRFQQNVVDAEKDDIADWLSRAKTSVTSVLENSNLNFYDQEFHEYGNFIKPTTKPKYGKEYLSDYAAVQTVLYTSKEMNMIFSPVMKKLKNRWQSLFNERFSINIDVTRRQVQKRFKKLVSMSPGGKWYMCDFSKFDKSQQHNCMALEWYALQRLGIDSYLLAIWQNGHYECSFSSFVAGFKAYLELQRKSGDSATAFLNTLITYLTNIWATRHYSHLIVGGDAIGDDILLRILQEFPTTGMAECIASKFNLGCKISVRDIADYCSSFVLSDGTYVPDPLKYVIKLGSHTIVGGHDIDYSLWSDENKRFFESYVDNNFPKTKFKGDVRFNEILVTKKLYDKFISARDNFWNLDNQSIVDELNYVLQAHHLHSVDYVPLIRAIVTIHDDFGLYRSLYSSKVMVHKF